MDPNEALKTLRRQAAEVLDRYENNRTGKRFADAAYDLAQAAEALDSWIKGGGFLPQDWQTKE